MVRTARHLLCIWKYQNNSFWNEQNELLNKGFQYILSESFRIIWHTRLLQNWVPMFRRLKIFHWPSSSRSPPRILIQWSINGYFEGSVRDPRVVVRGYFNHREDLYFHWCNLIVKFKTSFLNKFNQIILGNFVVIWPNVWGYESEGHRNRKPSPDHFFIIVICMLQRLQLN